jgi:hypothetical protein
VGPPSPSAVESPGPLRGDGEFNTRHRVSACILQRRVLFLTFLKISSRQYSVVGL